MAAPRSAPRDITASDEATGAVRGELRRAIATAAQRASVLASIASQVTAVTTELMVDAAPDEHRQRAHELRGAVLHALSVLADLQDVGGRLETLAAIQESLLAASPSPAD